MSTDSVEPHLRIELVSNPLLLGGVRELLGNVSRRFGFPDADSSKIALAVDEALCNVMRHGYDRRQDGRIWISVWILGSGGRASPDVGACDHGRAIGAAGIRITIDDEAKQVDPDQIKSRDLSDIRPGGLGVHIIREVMDEATYARRETNGMRLTMVKMLKAGDAPCCAGAVGAPTAPPNVQVSPVAPIRSEADAGSRTATQEGARGHVA
ncbi:MAG: ATP-binding protein [Planctomycetota bacterium]|nr:ATP-binding protein [Planctomycetota bacterium]